MRPARWGQRGKLGRRQDGRVAQEGEAEHTAELGEGPGAVDGPLLARAGLLVGVVVVGAAGGGVFGALPFQEAEEVVAQVGADEGQGVMALDGELGQLVRVADPRVHEDFGRVEAAGGEDGFVAGGVGLAGGGEDAGGGFVTGGEEDLGDGGGGEDR